jgi:hypothetical protein
MADEPMSELLQRTEDAVSAIRQFTEQYASMAVGAAGTMLGSTAHPTAGPGALRRSAEEAVDLGMAWVEPVRRLSEDQRRFAEEMRVWAERNRQFADEVATWAEALEAFARRLESWTTPFLTFSESLGAAMKTVARSVLPGDGLPGDGLPGDDGPADGAVGQDAQTDEE